MDKLNLSYTDMNNQVIEECQNLAPNIVQMSGPFKNPKHRWFLIPLLMTALSITHLCFDLSPLKSFLLADKQFPLTEFQFNLLYSIIGLVNFFVCFLDAMFIGVFGDTYGLFLGVFNVSFGQFLLYTGYSNQDFTEMVIGRVILGIGFDLVIEGTISLCNCWFKAYEVSFAHGWFTFSSLLGMICGQILLPNLFTYQKDIFFLIIFFISLISIIAAGLIIFLDKKLVNRKIDTLPLMKVEPDVRTAIRKHFKNVGQVDYVFLMFIFGGSTYLGTYNIYLANDNELLGSIWKLDPMTSGYLITFAIIVNIISSPISGWMLDKFKLYSSFSILAGYTSVLFGFSLIMAFHDFHYLTSLLPLFFIGYGNGIFRPAFYSTSVSVTKHMKVHKGYVGFLTSAQYVVFSLGNLLFGQIRQRLKDSKTDLLVIECFISTLLCIAIILMITSWALGNEIRATKAEVTVDGTLNDIEEDHIYLEKTDRNSLFRMRSFMNSENNQLVQLMRRSKLSLRRISLV